MNFQFNWVDLVIIVILIYFLSDSWRLGFWVILADFLGFLISLVAALFCYSFASSVLQTNLSLPRSLANALGFLFVAGLSEAVISFILSSLIAKIPYNLWKKPWSNILAMPLAFGQGVVLVTFLLTLVMSLPIVPSVKVDINDSKIGGLILQRSSGFEARIKDVFGGIIDDTLTYLTIKPGSQEFVPLNVTKHTLSVDEASEKQMFLLVNQERRKRGINELSLREEVIPVALSHATDMWNRNYFGHVSPDGNDVGDRLNGAGIDYSVAGENLALAPTIQTAHTGLMNSEGHRRNILDPEFKRLGIGVVDNGVYGKMFVQVFTD